MTETSRPTCDLTDWCALDPGHDGGCSIIRALKPPRIDLSALDNAVAQFLAGMRAGLKPRTRADFVLVPDPLPAVGGNTMQHELITDPSGAAPDEPRVDVNRYIASQQKALGIADEYTGIAAQLGALVHQMKGLKSRQVRDPEDGDLTAPAMLRSSLVKFDIGEAISRLERIQVQALGYGGAWGLLADEWHGNAQRALAAEETHDHLTMPESTVTDVLVDDHTDREYDATHGEADA